MPLDLPRSEPKIAGSFDRTRSLESTLAHERVIREGCGITRVAELTHLDRIGIPVFAAIVPDSGDTVSLYLGKGTTPEAARSGAIMEAAERHAAIRSNETAGYDLVNGGDVDVPVIRPRWSIGFASGNTLTEAVYHALCELIERHVLAVAHAFAHERPRAMLAQLVGRPLDFPGFVDAEVAREYSVPTGSAIVDALLGRIIAAGLAVQLRSVELQPFPVVFIATITETRADGPRSIPGFGCSLSPEHAAIRAITEAAQARLVDIQSAREDLSVEGAPAVRRPLPHPEGRWYFDAPARSSTLERLPNRASCDLAGDVRAIVALLRSAGYDRAIVIDTSPPALPVAAVRAVIPNFETTLIDAAAGPTIARIMDVTRNPRDLGLIFN